MVHDVLLIFVYCRMRSLIWGRSVGKENKQAKEIGEGVWNYEAWYLRVISVEPENNKTWLQSQHCGNRKPKR